MRVICVLVGSLCLGVFVFVSLTYGDAGDAGNLARRLGMISSFTNDVTMEDVKKMHSGKMYSIDADGQHEVILPNDAGLLRISHRIQNAGATHKMVNKETQTFEETMENEPRGMLGSDSMHREEQNYWDRVLQQSANLGTEPPESKPPPTQAPFNYYNWWNNRHHGGRWGRPGPGSSSGGRGRGSGSRSGPSPGSSGGRGRGPGSGGPGPGKGGKRGKRRT